MLQLLAGLAGSAVTGASEAGNKAYDAYHQVRMDALDRKNKDNSYKEMVKTVDVNVMNSQVKLINKIQF